MTTCRISDMGTPDDPTNDEFQCSTETVTVERNKGKSTFQRRDNRVRIMWDWTLFPSPARRRQQ